VDPGFGVEDSGRDPGRLIHLMRGALESIFVEAAEPRRYECGRSLRLHRLAAGDDVYGDAAIVVVCDEGIALGLSLSSLRRSHSSSRPTLPINGKHKYEPDATASIGA
jgi:hypothetical protein